MLKHNQDKAVIAAEDWRSTVEMSTQVWCPTPDDDTGSLEHNIICYYNSISWALIDEQSQKTEISWSPKNHLKCTSSISAVMYQEQTTKSWNWPVMEAYTWERSTAMTSGCLLDWKCGCTAAKREGTDQSTPQRGLSRVSQSIPKVPLLMCPAGGNIQKVRCSEIRSQTKAWTHLW